MDGRCTARPIYICRPILRSIWLERRLRRRLKGEAKTQWEELNKQLDNMRIRSRPIFREGMGMIDGSATRRRRICFGVGCTIAWAGGAAGLSTAPR